MDSEYETLYVEMNSCQICGGKLRLIEHEMVACNKCNQVTLLGERARLAVQHAELNKRFKDTPGSAYGGNWNGTAMVGSSAGFYMPTSLAIGTADPVTINMPKQQVFVIASMPANINNTIGGSDD